MTARYGWQPRVGLEDGLERTIAYFRDATQAPLLEAAA
jgi:hypothetical protein